MTQVLIPLDGSSYSAAVLDTLETLLEPGNVQLTLLRVAPLPEGADDPVPALLLERWVTTRNWDEAVDSVDGYIKETVTEQREAVLSSLRSHAERAETKGYTVKPLCAFGNPATEILRAAKELETDLILMATHGRSGLSRALMGSVAERVVRETALPVLLVKPEAPT